VPSLGAWRNPTDAYLPEQDLLLPPILGDWLPEDHLAYFVSDVVDQLDLSAIESVYEEEERGQPPYHLRMMTKLLLYGYSVGVFSSRRIQKKLTEDVGFSNVGGGEQTGFPNDLGLSAAASGGAATVV
jgi:transposase